MIANAITGGNREHIAGIVRAGALTPLSDMLTVMDCSVVVVVLKALAEILECGEYCKGSILTLCTSFFASLHKHMNLF